MTTAIRIGAIRAELETAQAYTRVSRENPDAETRAQAAALAAERLDRVALEAAREAFLLRGGRGT